MSYIDIIKNRRSIYDLNDQLPVSEKVVVNTIKHVTVESPTAFNMQSSHLVILMNDDHKKLWEIVTNTLKKQVEESKFASTQAKMDMFSKAKGTILFFDDRHVIDQLKKDFPLYQNQFDMFADHSMGLLQGNIWNSLAELKIGASLQHYNPLIDDEVKRQWEIPEYYRLTAQMVFGGIGSIPEPKEKIDADDRVIVYSNNS